MVIECVDEEWCELEFDCNIMEIVFVLQCCVVENIVIFKVGVMLFVQCDVVLMIEFIDFICGLNDGGDLYGLFGFGWIQFVLLEEVFVFEV